MVNTCHRPVFWLTMESVILLPHMKISGRLLVLVSTEESCSFMVSSGSSIQLIFRLQAFSTSCTQCFSE